MGVVYFIIKKRKRKKTDIDYHQSIHENVIREEREGLVGDMRSNYTSYHLQDDMHCRLESNTAWHLICLCDELHIAVLVQEDRDSSN